MKAGNLDLAYHFILFFDSSEQWRGGTGPSGIEFKVSGNKMLEWVPLNGLLLVCSKYQQYIYVYI